jgi:hypothetical protein
MFEPGSMFLVALDVVFTFYKIIAESCLYKYIYSEISATGSVTYVEYCLGVQQSPLNQSEPREFGIRKSNVADTSERQ